MSAFDCAGCRWTGSVFLDSPHRWFKCANCGRRFHSSSCFGTDGSGTTCVCGLDDRRRTDLDRANRRAE